MFVTFFYFCEKLHDMEEYKLINYSDIFLSYFHQVGRECTFRVKNHTLFYVCSGEMEINERGTVTKFHRGECAFIRRDNRVTLNKRCIEEGKPFISITLIFSRKFLLEFYRSMNKEGVPANIRRSKTSLLKIPSRPDVMSLFESIKPYYDSSIEPDEDWIRLKMMEGLQVVLKTDRDVYASLFDFAEPWKIDLLGFMEENYMYDLSLEELALYTGRSLSSFKNDFKRISGVSPRKWIVNKRLEVAHDRLTSGSCKVGEVMADVGFKNFSHFSKIYKETYGVAPSLSN